MTVQALTARMVAEFDEVREVHASTDGFDYGFGGGARDDRPDVGDAPF
jgi:hypothetical protein